MKKIYIALALIFIVLFLSACGSEKENIQENEIENQVKVDSNIVIYESETSTWWTDFFALDINNTNFEQSNEKIDWVFERQYLDDTKLQIILVSSNHMYSYKDIDYLNFTELSWKKPTSFNIIKTKMWWHHVTVLLNFALDTNIDELKFNNSPVWDIVLKFNN